MKITRYLCFAVIFTLFFTNCNYRTVPNFKNDLLPGQVIFLHEFSMVDSLQTGWLNGLERNLLSQTILSNALKENTHTFSSAEVNLDKFEREHLKPIRLNPGLKNNFSFNEMLFLEYWYFNAENLCLYKWTRGFAPVEVKSDTITNLVNKKILFWNIYASEELNFNMKDDVRLAEDITYELKPDSLNSKYFDKHIFIELLIGKILNKSVPVFDFYNGDQLSRKELIKRFGFEGEKVWFLDSITGTMQYKFKEDWSDQEFINLLNYNELNDFLFTEDWFINKSTSRIYKKVKSLSFIREFKRQDELVKKILFRIRLNDSPSNEFETNALKFIF